MVGGVATDGVHAYVRAADGDAVDIRARMMSGGTEDAATGSANCALMGLLGCQQMDAGQLELKIAQGVEVSAPIAASVSLVCSLGRLSHAALMIP